MIQDIFPHIFDNTFLMVEPKNKDIVIIFQEEHILLHKQTGEKALIKFEEFDDMNNLIYLFIFHYNFIRPHGSLNNCTPAEVAGFASDSLAKNSWFSAV